MSGLVHAFPTACRLAFPRRSWTAARGSRRVRSRAMPTTQLRYKLPKAALRWGAQCHEQPPNMERYALLLTLLALSAARRRSTNIACAPLDAASGEPARVCAPAVRPPAHRLTRGSTRAPKSSSATAATPSRPRRPSSCSATTPTSSRPRRRRRRRRRRRGRPPRGRRRRSRATARGRRAARRRARPSSASRRWRPSWRFSPGSSRRRS